MALVTMPPDDQRGESSACRLGLWSVSMPATPLRQRSESGAGPDQRRRAGIDASDAAGVAPAMGAVTAIPYRCEMFECAHI